VFDGFLLLPCDKSEGGVVQWDAPFWDVVRDSSSINIYNWARGGDASGLF